MKLLRLLGSPSIRHRASALFAAACVIVTQIDGLLPDKHDGDVPVTRVVVGSVDGQSPTVPTDRPVPHPAYGMHVDHCAHAHAFTSSLSDGPADPSASDTSRPEAPCVQLASVAAPPHSRPPIV